jgi:hypothetical protein
VAYRDANSFQLEAGTMTSGRIRTIAECAIALGIVLMISTCSSQSVKMIQPQTGATAECSGAGYGVGTSFSEGFVGSCARAYENRGFVRLEQLTPEQRASLERRGLLPKD